MAYLHVKMPEAKPLDEQSDDRFFLKPISKRNVRRRQKKARVAGLDRMYVLDPELHYSRELDQLLRALVNFIANRGYAPTITVFAKCKSWNLETVRMYIHDLLASEDVQLAGINAYAPTEKGCKRVKKQYIAPLLPENIQAKKSAYREAQRVAKMLDDPDVAAIVEAQKLAKQHNAQQ